MIKKLLIILLVFILGVASWLFFTRKNSVVYRYSERAAVEYNGFVILNPFRDRGPEVAAEDVLSKLKAKDCDNALNLQEITPESREYICLRESWYPLTSWTLMDRRDEGHTRLLYRNYRGEMTDVGLSNNIHQSGPIEIHVYRTELGWVAMSYETYY